MGTCQKCGKSLTDSQTEMNPDMTTLWFSLIQAKDRHPFSLHHVKDALQVTFKKRPEPNRKYMFILMAMMIVQTAPFYGESIAYYFVRTQFEWDYKDFSQYSSIVSALGIAGI